MDKLRPRSQASAVKEDYAINRTGTLTTKGNALGPRGTTIVIQNARVDMAAGGIVNLVFQIPTTTYPKQALPVFTLDDRMQIHFNDNEIELFHFSPAHTNGDTAVIFRSKMQSI